MPKRTTNQSPADQKRNTWAPKNALAGRYRATANRYSTKAAEYRAMAERLEAEVEAIKGKSA
jgi:hypothetical protein